MCAMAPTFMDVRTTQPMNALAKIPGVTTEMLIREMKVEPIKDKSIPHILILQRHIPQDAKAWKEKMLRVADMGWLVVSEWDDHPDKLPPGIRERFGEAGWMAFTAAHAVQTSTQYLKKVFEKYNSSVMLFPNCIEQIREERYFLDKPKTIFFGALNRKEDWLPIISQINKFAEKNPEVAWRIMLDKDFYRELNTKNKIYVEAGNYMKYISEMDKCDICLMPLEDNEANKCKSDIKFVEASSRGLASIMSSTVYAETVKNGENGLIVDKNDWYSGLNKIVNEERYAAILAEKAREYVKEERILAGRIKERVKAYKNLYENKIDIQNDLVKRLNH